MHAKLKLLTVHSTGLYFQNAIKFINDQVAGFLHPWYTVQVNSFS